MYSLTKLQKNLLPILITCIWLFKIVDGYGQNNFWQKINKGFGPSCPPFGQGTASSAISGGFESKSNISHKGGFAYTMINPKAVGCGNGLYMHDTLQNQWIKVAGDPDNGNCGFCTSYLYSNGTDIINYKGNSLYLFTTDYTNYPNGWKGLANFPYVSAVFNSCQSNCSPGGCNSNDRVTPGSYGSFGLDATALIGDTLYYFYLSNCLTEQFKIIKFNYKTLTWTYKNLGQLPVPNGDANLTSGMAITSPASFGGKFQFFVMTSYSPLGNALGTVPNYVMAFNNQTNSWINISNGVNWTNQTGNFIGGGGGLTTNWAKNKLYVSSQQGIWQWAGTGWYQVGAYWGNAPTYPTTYGLYVPGLPKVELIDLYTSKPIGQSNDDLNGTSCPFEDDFFNAGRRSFMSPDDGKNLYVFRTSPPDYPICTVNSRETNGFFRLRANVENIPAPVNNLHVNTATYLGNNGHNDPVGVTLTGKKKLSLFVAGNFNLDPFSPVTYTSTDLRGTGSGKTGFTGPGRSGKVLRLNAAGDTLKEVLTLSDTIYDFDSQNFGEMRQVITGSFGVSVLDSSGKLLWAKPISNPLKTPIKADINDKGWVVTLHQAAAFNHVIQLFDPSGTLMASTTTAKERAYDITIKGDTIFMVGEFNTSGVCSVVRIPYMFVYKYTGSSITSLYSLWNFTNADMAGDCADAMLYKVDVGLNNRVYVAGHTAGGNTVFRWDGTVNEVTFGGQPPNKLIETGDYYTNVQNTRDENKLYFGVIDEVNRRIEKGQIVIPRLPTGAGNTVDISEGNIKADKDGRLYVMGRSFYAIKGRDTKNVNGQIVGTYNGGEPMYLQVSADFRTHLVWHTFGKNVGGDKTKTGVGRGRGVAIRDSSVALIARMNSGFNIPVKPIIQNPFYVVQDAGGKRDAYLVTMIKDAWKVAKKDTIALPYTPGDSIIPTIPADPPQITTGLIQERSICPGDKIDVPFVVNNRKFRAGNVFTVQLSDATGSFTNPVNIGTLTDSVSGIIKSTIPISTLSGTTYKIRVISTNPAVVGSITQASINIGTDLTAAGAIFGPNSVCSGQYGINYSVSPLARVISYNWSVPTGAIILSGQGTNAVSIDFSTSSGGTVSVVPVYSCGVGGNSSAQVAVSNCLTPLAQFSALPLSTCTGSNVQFSDQSINASSWSWTFGPDANPATSTVQNPSVSFTTIGLKEVSLIVNNGASFETKTAYINVTNSASGPPPVIFGDDKICQYPGALPPSGINVAKGKPAAGFWSGGIRTAGAGNLTDGNAATSFTTNNEEPVWFAVNLGADTYLDKIAINLTNGGAIRNFVVEVAPNGSPLSNGWPSSGFTVIKTVTNNAAPILELNALAITTQYIRVRVTTRYGGDPSINEIQAFGPDLRTVYCVPPVSGATQYNWTLPDGTEVSTSNECITVDFASVNIPVGGKIRVTTNSTCVTWSGPAELPVSYSPDCNITANPITIQTGVVSNLNPCPGATLTVPFIVTGSFNAANIFTAQLSNASGSFATPVSIGTFSGTLSSNGAISATLPLSISAGTNYRIRVISSNPYILGSDNGTGISINSCTNSILTKPIVPPSFCVGGSVTIPFTASGTYNAGNIYVAQLSNNSGSFVLPVTLGSLVSNANGELSIVGQFPSNFTQGNGYRIRVISSNPTVTGSETTNDLTVRSKPANTGPIDLDKGIDCNTYANSRFMVDPVLFATGYRWKFNPAGPVIVSGENTRTIYVAFPTLASPQSYIVTVKAFNECDSASNASTYTANAPTLSACAKLIAGEILSPVACAGGTISVPYTATGSFIGQAMVVRLSDNTGNFANYQSNVNVNSALASGIVLLPVPINLALGTGYKVRIFANNFGFASTSITTLTVQNCETINLNTIVTNPLCVGKAISLTYTATGTFLAGNTFTAQLSSPIGSFVAPVTLGNVNSITSGTINGTIPAGVFSGTGYRIRIISSNPARVGTISPADLSVFRKPGDVLAIATPSEIGNNSSRVCTNASTTYEIGSVLGATSYRWKIPNVLGSITAFNGTSIATSTQITVTYGSTIGTGSVSVTAVNSCDSSNNRKSIGVSVAICEDLVTSNVQAVGNKLCTGTNFNVSFTTAASYTAGNQFIAELSDASGNFTSPVQIGSISSTTVAPISANISPLGFVPGTGYKIRVRSTNPLVIGTAFSANLDINSKPSDPANFSSSISTVCAGSSGNVFTIPAITGASYRWQIPIGSTITSPLGLTGTSVVTTSNSITLAFGTTSGKVSVRAFNNCDSSTNSTEQIINVSPCSLTITGVTGAGGSSTYCPNQTINVAFSTVGSFETGNSFQLQLSDAFGVFAGGTASNLGTAIPGLGSGSISEILPSTVSGSGYKIRVISSSPVRQSPDFNLILPEVPNMGATIITGSASVCTAQAGVTYSIPAVSGSTGYRWSIPQGAIVTSPTGISGTSFVTNETSITITFGNNSGNVSVRAFNTCGDSALNAVSQLIALSPCDLSISSISPATICEGNSISVNYATGSTFNAGNVFKLQLSDATGQFGAGLTELGSLNSTSSGTISGTLPAGITGNIYKVRVISTLPVLISSESSLNILPKPVTGNRTINGSATLCSNQTGNSYTISSPIPNASSYKWIFPAGFTIQGFSGNVAIGPNLTAIQVNAGSVGGEVIIRAFTACNDSTADVSLTVSVQNCIIDFSPSATVSCVQSSISFGNVTAGAATYLWNFGQGAIPATSTLETPPAITYNTPGQKTVRLTINAGIAGQELSKEVQIQINDLPGLPDLINTQAELCGSKTVTLSVNQLPGTNSYVWQYPIGWSISSGSDTTAVINVLTGTTGGLVSVRGKNECGIGPATSRSFFIKNDTIPTVTVTNSGLSICPGNLVSFKLISADTTGSISWFVNDEIVAGNKTTRFSASTFSAGDRVKASINYNSQCLGLVSATTEAQFVVFKASPFDKILPVIGELEVCNQDEKTYSVPDGSDFTFNWSLPEGVVIESAQGSASIKVKVENLERPDTISVSVTDSNACIWSYALSKIQIWEKCGTITIANVFTPSIGDKNSVWLIDGLQEYPNASIKVFNRWGGKVFESKGYTKPWDGTKGGEPLPTAAYYYIIDLKDTNRTFTGSVTIVR
jgi:gliding motility-associated-like protein